MRRVPPASTSTSSPPTTTSSKPSSRSSSLGSGESADVLRRPEDVRVADRHPGGHLLVRRRPAAQGGACRRARRPRTRRRRFGPRPTIPPLAPPPLHLLRGRPDRADRGAGQALNNG